MHPALKNWVTVPIEHMDVALSLAKKYPNYITNDYGCIKGRTDAMTKGNDYTVIDFFFMNTGNTDMQEFESTQWIKK